MPLPPPATPASDPDAAFDRLARLAARLLGCPIALVTLVEADRQRFAGCTGLAGQLAAMREAPFSHSLCRRVVESGVPLVVADARAHPALRDDGAVTHYGLVAYAGVPLVAPDGHVLGTVCAADVAPRAWSDDDLATLQDVAAAAASELSLRLTTATLAEERARFRALLDQTGELVVTTSADGRITYVNAAFRAALAVTLDDAAAMRPIDFVAPEHRTRYVAAGRRVLAGEPVAEFEAVLVAGDGRRVVCRGSAVPEWRDGQVVGTRAAFRDVTALHHADALRARLAATLDASPDFVAMATRDGRLCYLNRAGRRLVGVPEDAPAEALTLDDFRTPEEAARARAEFLPAALRDGSWRGESVLRGADGAPVPVSQVIVAHPSTRPDDATPHFLSTVMRDLRDRVAAEGALRESEARFRGISAASPVGIFHAGLDGVLHYANPRLAQIYGVAADALFGLRWLEHVHADDVDAVVSGWTAANEAGEEYEHVFRLRTDDGAVRWVHGRSAVVRDADGRPVGTVGTVEDVTTQRTSEAAARRLTAILEASPDIVAVATPAGRIDYLNAAGRRLLGIAGGPEAVVAAGIRVADVQPQFAPGGAEFAAVEHAVAEGCWRGETELTKCDGRHIPVEQVLLAHRAPDGSLEYLSSVLRDITERRQTESTLRGFALLDELTGLYNRRGFLALAEREWQRAAAARHGAVLVYADLDAFKAVNDTHGHAEGDRALQDAAAVLRRTFRDADVLGRLGGDEFVALALCGPGQTPAATAERVRGRLAATLEAANATARAARRPYDLALSVGVALFDGGVRSHPADSLAALMVRADEALYEEKRARRATRAA